MKIVWNKKRKIIVSVVAAVLAVVICLTCVLVNVQFPQQNYGLFSMARDVLLKNFDEFKIGVPAKPKRVIDSENPLNLVNYYGNEPLLDLWQSIPDNQKPYTIILLIPGQVLLPKCEQALKNLEKWADECEANQIPYSIQNINGETHMEARPPIQYLEDRFASRHQYFYGLNAAELYNGVTWRGEAESDNSLYIIDMIKLCAKYGAFFIWSDTNLNYKSGMLLHWLENNDSFYSAFKSYSDYIFLMNKESIADPSTYAVMQGLWMSGLIGGWGVKSDWWHWQVDGYKSLFGKNDNLVDNEWEQIFSFPENMYVQSMMLVMSRGGCCFAQEAPNFSVSYGGRPIAGYEYAISPLLDRIIDGRIVIPNKEDVFAKTKFAVLGKQNYQLPNYNFSESNLYPAQGAGGIVPLLPSNLRRQERSEFLRRGVVLVNYKVSEDEFMRVYGSNDADTYLTNTAQSWYFINNLENKEGSKYAKFEPKFASSGSFYIKAEEHTSAIITDKQNGFNVYLSNYRTDKTAMLAKSGDGVYNAEGGWSQYCGNHLTLDDKGNPLGVSDTALRKTIIEVQGSYNGGEPMVKFNNNPDGSGGGNRPYKVQSIYDASTKVLRLEIEHNGIVDIDITLTGSGKEYEIGPRDRADDIIQPVTADVTALEQLVKTKVDDKHNYTYFGYLEYDKQFARAQVMIAEGTYTQKQIDKQVELLTKAKQNLIDISDSIALLRQVNDGDYSAAAMEEFDSLLREILTCQKYVEGRSNQLRYKSIYRNKSITATFNGKRKAIERWTKNLRLYV